MLRAGDLYLRPPHVVVATAVAGCDPGTQFNDFNFYKPPAVGSATESWRHADWLNRISVASKQDYARLQGARFMFVHAHVRSGFSCYALIEPCHRQQAEKRVAVGLPLHHYPQMCAPGCARWTGCSRQGPAPSYSDTPGFMIYIIGFIDCKVWIRAYTLNCTKSWTTSMPELPRRQCKFMFLAAF